MTLPITMTRRAFGLGSLATLFTAACGAPSSQPLSSTTLPSSHLRIDTLSNLGNNAYLSDILVPRGRENTAYILATGQRDDATQNALWRDSLGGQLTQDSISRALQRNQQNLQQLTLLPGNRFVITTQNGFFSGTLNDEGSVNFTGFPNNTNQGGRAVYFEETRTLVIPVANLNDDAGYNAGNLLVYDVDAQGQIAPTPRSTLQTSALNPTALHQTTTGLLVLNSGHPNETVGISGALELINISNGNSLGSVPLPNNVQVAGALSFLGDNEVVLGVAGGRPRLVIANLSVGNLTERTRTITLQGSNGIVGVNILGDNLVVTQFADETIRLLSPSGSVLDTQVTSLGADRPGRRVGASAIGYIGGIETVLRAGAGNLLGIQAV